MQQLFALFRVLSHLVVDFLQVSGFLRDPTEHLLLFSELCVSRCAFAFQIFTVSRKFVLFFDGLVGKELSSFALKAPVDFVYVVGRAYHCREITRLVEVA